VFVEVRDAEEQNVTRTATPAKQNNKTHHDKDKAGRSYFRVNFINTKLRPF
jgi:hypothetical protein